MADYGHVTAWSGIRTGREKQALSIWADAVDFYEKCKANSLIDDYEVQIFLPSGGALPTGIITIWGSEDQVSAYERNEDRMALSVRAGLALEGFVESKSVRGGAMLEGIGTFSTAVDAL